VNNGRFTVRVLGVPYVPPLPWTAARIRLHIEPCLPLFRFKRSRAQMGEAVVIWQLESIKHQRDFA
jgi:hypothetical protein